MDYASPNGWLRFTFPCERLRRPNAVESPFGLSAVLPHVKSHGVASRFLGERQMPSPLQSFRVALPLMTCLGFLVGCATTSSTQPPQPVASGSPAAATISAENEFVPVVRYGRYTLIELVPEFSQRDLLQQVIEVSIPPTLDASVGDAMHHVLLRSGYRLCDDAAAKALYRLPLPAAHLHLGPLILRDALLTLAGPAWDLSIDDAARQVCFTRHPTPAPPPPGPTSTATAISPNTAETPFEPPEEARP